MDLSKTLREEIKRHKLRPTDVAEGSGVPFSTVSEFMRGVREIGVDKASLIATFLGFSVTGQDASNKHLIPANHVIEVSASSYEVGQHGYAPWPNPILVKLRR